MLDTSNKSARRGLARFAPVGALTLTAAVLAACAQEPVRPAPVMAPAASPAPAQTFTPAPAPAPVPRARG